MVAIIDYGLGNLRSLMNALEAIGTKSDLVSDPESLGQYDRIILPGVGAIAEAMETLTQRGLGEALIERARSGVPILGVCLGMQLLCTRSFEGGEHQALGLIDADVVPFDPEAGLKIPHIGWNSIEPAKDHRLLDGVEPGTDVYFVHSYYVQCRCKDDALASTDYGTNFTSMIARHNVVGAQFHPEKSQFAGLRMLENFVSQ